MDIRKQWDEHAANVEHSLEEASIIAAEAKKYFDDYLVIDEEMKTLNTQWDNWKNNRFEIVVVGEFSTGKSTFINALLQKDVLPSQVTPTTATINFIRHIEQGDGTEKAVITFFNGTKAESSFDNLEEYVTEMSKEHNVVEEISYVELFVDSPYLREGVVIVDTPGLQALHPEHERITKNQIKKSNASILLFNMEQPGKRSEFMFLKDLSESIERIFFVGNRMDGVPENEIPDVINVLESALRDNEYQPVSVEKAKVYPISALQALKARVENVQTKYWNNWSKEQLIKASRFLEFERRLEDYLFNGEKTQDLIRTPFQALQYFYHQLKAKINEIEVTISGEISLEALKKEKERLMEEVELRKLQLQEQERKLKSLFQDVLFEHESSFNERKDHIMQYLLGQINEIEFIDELEDGVSDVMLQLNHEIPELVDQGIRDLSSQLEMKMRREIDDFELSIEDYSKDRIQTLTDKEINVSAKVKSSTLQDDIGKMEQKFAEEAAALEEQKKLLKEKQQHEKDLIGVKNDQDFLRRIHQQEERFLDMLINSTDATKKEYGVIKKRRFWFDKKGLIDVKNEDYENLVKEKRESMKKAINEERNLHEKSSQIERKMVFSESEFDSIQEYKEAKRELKEKITAEKLQRLRERTNLEERQLKREKKKVNREIENIFENLRREYRSLLRSLDALKLAQKGIESYIQEKDVELNVKLKDLASKEKLLDENTQKQEIYKSNAEMICAKLENENELITNFLLECY